MNIAVNFHCTNHAGAPAGSASAKFFAPAEFDVQICTVELSMAGARAVFFFDAANGAAAAAFAEAFNRATINTTGATA